jgi:hypothetical protein
MQNQQPPRVLQALSDFEFVAQGPSDKDLPVHSVRAIAPPEKLEAEHLYVFHHRPIDNGELFAGLQERFRSKGVKVLKASGDIERYLGGLAFAISFRDGNVQGVILNTLDPQIVRDDALAAQWALDDYVVVINGAKSLGIPLTNRWRYRPADGTDNRQLDIW